MGIPKDVQDFLDNEDDLLEGLIENNNEDEEVPPEEEGQEEEQVEDTSEETEDSTEADGDQEEQEGKSAEPDEFEFTPREAEGKPEEDPTEITRKILEKLDSISGPKKEEPKEEDKPVKESDVERQLRELREELQAYKSNSEAQKRDKFISGIREKVKEIFPKNSFEEIVNSQQFDSFLDTDPHEYGVSLRTLLKNAMDNENSKAVYKIFADFKFSNSPKKDTTKPSLEDLAVPEKSGAKSSPRRKSKFDFKASEYQENLEKFERGGKGGMSQKEFDDFSLKFSKALDEGRVDMDN